MDQWPSKASRRLGRREFLKASVIASSAALLAACQTPAAPAPTTAPAPKATEAPKPAATAAPAGTKAPGDAFSWQRFKGEKIEVQLIKSPRGDVLQQNQKEFENLTGIQVGSEQVPEQQLRQKQVIEFTSGSTTFDVTQNSLHVQKRLFGKGKWLLDLRDYLKDPTLTSPDYDYADFAKSALDYAAQVDGRVDTLVQSNDYFILYWNKELFQAKGVQYPNTLDEMLAAAQKLNDPGKGVYGFVGRGLKNANVPLWYSFLLGWDVDGIDDKAVMHTDGPEAIAAAELYKKLMKDYAPPGVAGFNWNEAQTAFAQGTAAMWYDGVGFAEPLEDKTKSKIVGKVGYGFPPAGPKGRFASMSGAAMGVSSFSKKPGPSYYYCQWATNKVNAGRILAAGGGAPARTSAYKDQSALANLKVPKEWVDVLLQCIKVGRSMLPIVIPVTEFRDIFGVALTNMIGGADPATELKKATAEFKPVLEKSEKS